MEQIAKKKAADSENGCLGGPNYRDHILTLLGRYEKAKFKSDDMLKYLKSIVEKLDCRSSFYREVMGRYHKLLECGKYLKVQDYYLTQNLKFISCRCRNHLLCQSCAIVRGSRMMGNVLRRVKSKKLYKYYPYLLTVTVRDGDDLGERFRKLSESWGKLINRRKGRTTAEWGSNSLKYLIAGVASFEVKRGKNSGLWHPHMHALVFSEVELDIYKDFRGSYRWDDLSREWLKITGDSMIVECHPITGYDGEKLKPHEIVKKISDEEEFTEEFINAVCEVSKYALKVGEMKPDDVYECWSKLTGRRMVRTFGEMRGKIDDDGECNIDDLGPFIEHVYVWGSSGYSLIRHKVADAFERRKDMSDKDLTILEKLRVLNSQGKIPR